MPPNKTLDDYQESLKENLKRLLKKEEHEHQSKEATIVPSNCPDDCPEKSAVLSRLPVSSPSKRTKTKSILWGILNNAQENLSIKNIMAEAKVMGYDISMEQTKKSCNRLVSEGKIFKEKIGNVSYYYITKHKKIEQITEQISELEKKLSETVMMGKAELPKLHKITLILNRDNLQRVRDKIKATQSTSHYPLSPEQMTSTVMNSQSNESIFQRWGRQALPENMKVIKGGFQESVAVTIGTGFKGTVKVQVFETGSLLITADFSQHPIDMIRWREFEQWLTGMMQGRCGYGFLEMTDYFSIMFEWSIDKTMQDFDASGKYSWTVRQFDEVYMRIYTKELEQGWVQRREVGLNEPIPYDNYLKEAQAMIQGGINMQWMFKSQHQNENFQKTALNELDKQAKAIQYLLKQTQQQGMINQQLLEFLKVQDTKKPEKEKIISPNSDIPADRHRDEKPKIMQGLTPYVPCQKCGREIWVALSKCPICNGEQKRDKK